MTMIITDLGALRAQVAQWKSQTLRIGFVPTMGNLHEGHHSLVRLARQHADRVVVSVFVNPTQFGPHEDFSRYPRTPEADAEGLGRSGADLMWMPDVATMYPLGLDAAVRVQVPGITSTLEGEHRPGHFDGVASVVARLLLQVQPDVAVFGRKDYQQLAVVRAMVTDLAFPVRVIAADTLREPDGLAMSSRNQYLSPDERPRAVEISRTLAFMRQALAEQVPPLQVEVQALERLSKAGFSVDYAALRRPDLTPLEGDVVGPVVALIAARLGRTRLIDNLEFDASAPILPPSAE